MHQIFGQIICHAFQLALAIPKKGQRGMEGTGNQEIELEPHPLKNYTFIDRTAVI